MALQDLASENLLRLVKYNITRGSLIDMEIQVKIEKSPIPIIWIDTSIIVKMTQWKKELSRHDPLTESRIKTIYENIHKLTRAGKLICPLAEQDDEIWLYREEWLGTIHDLSLGLQTLTCLSLFHKQLSSFLNAYVKKETTVTISYKEAFHSDPCEELRDTLKRPFFVTVNSPLPFGEDYHKELKANLLSALNRAREANVKNAIQFEEQLEKEYLGEIQVLFGFLRRLQESNFIDENDIFNAVSGASNLAYQLRLLENFTKKQNDIIGLIDFYMSKYHKAMPYVDLSCNLSTKMMIDKQRIRSGDYMDSRHISTIMPYSDIFITDKAMSTFLKKKGYDKKYCTKVCWIGEIGEIEAFFSEVDKGMPGA